MARFDEKVLKSPNFTILVFFLKNSRFGRKVLKPGYIGFR